MDGVYLKKTNALTFKFFLPVLLFNNIYKVQIAEAFDGGMSVLFGIVRRIFSLCMDDNAPTQIARILREGQVLTPAAYQSRMKQAVRCIPLDAPYHWDGSTASAILKRMEYCGHTVNFKTNRQSCTAL